MPFPYPCLVTRPPGAEHLKNPHGIHAAFVYSIPEPVDDTVTPEMMAEAAIRAANALVPHLNEPFAGYDVTVIDVFITENIAPCAIQGDAVGLMLGQRRPRGA